MKSWVGKRCQEIFNTLFRGVVCLGQRVFNELREEILDNYMKVKAKIKGQRLGHQVFVEYWFQKLVQWVYLTADGKNFEETSLWHCMRSLMFLSQFKLGIDSLWEPSKEEREHMEYFETRHTRKPYVYRRKQKQLSLHSVNRGSMEGGRGASMMREIASRH